MSSGGRRAPPRDLHGRRPLSPLKLRRDSQKIKKPPVVPPPPPPVIIYSVSPEVIHTSPHDFMGLVQRLTGPDPPATRSESAFVGCEKTKMPLEAKNYFNNNNGGWYGLHDSQPWPDPITDPNPVIMNLHHQDCHWSPIQQPPPVVGGGGEESGDNNTSKFLLGPSTHSRDPLMTFPTSFALIGSLLDQ